ncbi:FLUCTUATING-LIGHT-ACCLIMATION protein 1, chloroplastic-like [Bidens hawaiensis]|uniref:FLUCTUATING-LIGHT-ACCLIMATION protein 1, chloroplastic-like n=1 Tax=Bidens hawaiensis TaxID=980011 RepID=UPI00404928A5
MPTSRHLTNFAGINAVIKRSKENAHHQAPLPLAAISGGQESSSSETYSTQISSPATSSAKTDSDLSIPPGLYYTILVGVLGTYRSLQKDLAWIAANTSKGLSYVLQEATLALLWHPDYCISGYSSGDVNGSDVECNKRFNRFSIEERSKFDVVRANDIRKKSATTQSSNNEYIVVTILVAAWSCAWKLPPVRRVEQLKNALQDLASIPSNYIRDVEVLWNPQHENSSLTEQQLLEDYPLLNPI